jgi:uncharacterized membrane-anchored protein
MDCMAVLTSRTIRHYYEHMARNMNKIVITLGGVLLIASVVAITYTTTEVNPEPPCGYPPCYPALQVPAPINPYVSEGTLLALLGALLMGVGFFISTRTNQTGTISPTN